MTGLVVLAGLDALVCGPSVDDASSSTPGSSAPADASTTDASTTASTAGSTTAADDSDDNCPADVTAIADMCRASRTPAACAAVQAQGLCAWCSWMSWYPVSRENGECVFGEPEGECRLAGPFDICPDTSPPCDLSGTRLFVRSWDGALGVGTECFAGDAVYCEWDANGTNPNMDECDCFCDPSFPG